MLFETISFNSKKLIIIIALLAAVQLVTANVLIVNGLTHIHSVEGGQLIKGVLELQNTSDEPQAVKIYQKDYGFNHKGAVFFDEPGTNNRSNANWIDFSPGFIELAPEEKSVILYEMIIPDGEELSGSYWSVLMVEGIASGAEQKPNDGFTINTVIRYAIQIVANIGETGIRNLEFVEAEINKLNGEKVGEISIENTGERLLQPVISVELFKEDGASLGIVKAEKKKIYPGTSTKFLLSLEEFPEGEYQAVVLADCNEEDLFGLNLTLKINGD